MTPEALHFESHIRRLITQGDLDGALGYVRFIVEHIRHDPASVGQTLTSPSLDRLCAEIGAASLLQLQQSGQLPSPARQQADVIILATELYAMGGHTRIIEDIILAQPEKRHLVLLTDFFDGGAKYKSSAKADFLIAEGEQRIDKLVWLQKELARHPQAQVLIFNHHADAAAIAAIQPEFNREVVFCHHADHHLCLGAHLSTHVNDARHVDFFAHHHKHCCNSGIAAEYWPISVPDRGSRSHAPETFLQQGHLVTCTSGVWTKFNPLYPFHYWEELPGMLLASGGTHIHIGDIPSGLLSVMREHLAASGVQPDRLIHIPHVSSVWDTLLEKKVDLYIGSFPLGGGRALTEALGAGVPIVTHCHPMLGANGLGPGDTWTWTTPDELQAILGNATRERLSTHSKSSRDHYLKFHNPKVFKACLAEGLVVPAPELTLHATDAVMAYLLRSASRQEGLDGVLQQLQQRVASNEAAIIVESSQSALEEGIALFKGGELEAAYAVFSQLVAHTPDSPIALMHLGLIALAAGLAEDADVFFKLAIECSPDRAATAAAIQQHCLGAGEHAPVAVIPAQAGIQYHAYSLDPGLRRDDDSRIRLRVGFVVGQLDADETSARLESLLCHLDPQNFETILFFDHITDTAVTQRIVLIADECHSISGRDTNAIVELIRSQRIDVLVNLQLHEHPPTLSVFSQRCAPLQLNWSLPARTSGMKHMDYVVCSESNYAAARFGEKLLAVDTAVRDPAFADAFGNALLARWQQQSESATVQP